MEIAEDKNIDSIAFPAISTGAFGYPTKDAAKIAFEVISEMVAELKAVKKI